MHQLVQSSHTLCKRYELHLLKSLKVELTILSMNRYSNIGISNGSDARFLTTVVKNIVLNFFF